MGAPEIDSAKGACQQLREAFFADGGVLWIVLLNQKLWVDFKHAYCARCSRKCGIHIPLRCKPSWTEVQEDNLSIFTHVRS